MRRFLVAVIASAACVPEPDADLEGPRVVWASLPTHAVEVPIVPDLWVELSEPALGSSVHAGAVALVAWEALGRCDLTPVCAKGSCAAGTCWGDPLGASDLNALDRGEWEGDPEHVVESELAVDGARIVVRPAGTLRPHARYSLVVGGGVQDASGAGLVDDAGFSARWRSDFVTGGEGSAGPMPRLSVPAPDAANVPTNLVQVQTAFAVPVQTVPGSSLWLGDAQTGGRVRLRAPEPCVGWVEGFCLAWTADTKLPASARLSVVDGALVDVAGRGLVLPFDDESFRTGPGPDEQVPALDDARVQLRGPCMLGSVWADEALSLSLELAGARAQVSGGPGEVAVALRTDGPGEAEALARLSAVDLAGNEASVERSVDGAALAQAVPTVSITELLANPAGPEPHQEFVELYNFGDAPVQLDGLWLADLPWEDVAAALAAGEKPPGDAVPAHALAPGALALVVAAGFDPADGRDEPPAPGTALLRVDASLGQGGLKNAGEPLTLYRADPPALVAGYGDYVDSSATAHGGRSVALVRPDACDVVSSWSSHPLGRATPGRLP